MVKRVVAALLAGCLAFCPGADFLMPVYGAAEAAQTQAPKSVLEVEVVSAQTFPFEGKVSVEVSGKSSGNQKLELDLKDKISSTARFQVAEGEYTVAVSAEKFAAYQQTVDVQAGWTHKIMVCSDDIEAGNSAGPGWIRIGDLNGDGRVDQTDSQMLVSALHSGRTDAVYDLNHDGKVDLADLKHLVNSLNGMQESSVEKQWILDAQNIQMSPGTRAEGNLNELFQEEGTVKLSTENGEPISAVNPVEAVFTLDQDGSQGVKLGGMAVCAPAGVDKADNNKDNNESGSVSSQIANGEIVLQYMDGNKEVIQTISLDANQRKLAARSSVRAEASVRTEAGGMLVIDFGGQIAVKKVSIRITGTKKAQPLAEIAKVEFVNDMESRISEPSLDIPAITSIKAGSRQLSVSWKAQTNITGYELYISGPVKNQEAAETQIISTSDASYSVTSINNKNMVNNKDYTLKVRSVNGDWRSPWSEAKTARTVTQKKPSPPDNVKAKGGYRSIEVSWKNMEDADGYMVYYKKSEDSEYQPAVKGFTQTKEGTGRLSGSRYTITGLEEHASYSVYVISWNELGWSGASLTSEAETRSEAVPKLPSYKRLNTSKGRGVLTKHIVSAYFGGSGNAVMTASPLDEVTDSNTALGLLDDDFASYWSKADWDDGVAYPGSSKGITITLDDEYAMNYFTFAAADQTTGVNRVSIAYWDQSGAHQAESVGAQLVEKKDQNSNPYYIVKLDKTIRANKIYMCLGRSWNSYAPMKVGEIHFHQYDSLEDDIMGLYQNEMHTTLKDEVTEESIRQLENRLETVDAASGEKHPLYQELALEIKTAREILNSQLEPEYQVHNQITAAKDRHLGFGGLNAWQPLGRAAYAGETLLVYVGHNTRRTGDTASLQLVFTQHHAESSALAQTVNLKVGRNMITVPQIADKEFERGGQLYVAYTGNDAADKYAVRISGGISIPVLDVYGKTGSERTQAVRSYLQQLEKHVSSLVGGHDQHKDKISGIAQDRQYDEKNCILNATDILMDQMMYSLPASQVWNSIGKSGIEEQIQKLDQALQAMEKTMALFYQHKGLSSQAGSKNGNNALPSQHLNIRYMRMFDGAFMYAAGNHIGIEWGSSTVAGAKSWDSFGWGIAHEIGHNINQGTYAVAEITNNYFAQLLTGKQRYTDENVYKKVTSGTTGRSSNVFTQLALYWQLHLAFDTSADDRQRYDSYQEQFDNLFFARVDTYSRNPEKAPQQGLKLNGGTDQNLMRLACAAANKNILPFFERWGMVPDKNTISYAEKYGKADTKALYYVNKQARDYRVSHAGEEGTILNQDAVKAEVDAESNKATITISTDKRQELIIGYEIIKSTTSNGVTASEVAGFVPIQTAASTKYVDTISAMNNRVISYEVRAVDQYLNYSLAVSAGSVKIQTDGILDKDAWTAETTMTSEDDKAVDKNEEDPDSGYHESSPQNVAQTTVNSADRMIDNLTEGDGIYHGNSNGEAQITIDMHKNEQVTALKYQGDALPSVTVRVSTDGKVWTTVKEDDEGLASGSGTVWFQSVKESEKNSWIGTYDARYVQLAFHKSGSVQIKEIDLCGPSGDNLEFLTADDKQPAVGILAEDYQYADGEDNVIKKGSLVFTGRYKGNPAYNVVMLYDTNGNVIGSGADGKVRAEQVIFAPVPEKGSMGETSDGTWVYYVEPGQWEANVSSITGVRGELYRVDDAKTLEGERIVSDTMILEMPKNLSEIRLTGSVIER